jgi:hypothetical protein
MWPRDGATRDDSDESGRGQPHSKTLPRRTACHSFPRGPGARLSSAALTSVRWRVDSIQDLYRPPPDVGGYCQCALGLNSD